MRKVIGISLLVFWLFQCSLPVILFKIGKYQLHIAHQKNSRRNKRNSKVFIFDSEEDIIWEKKGKELVINGGLFDVTERYDSADKIVIKAFADKKEDKLIKDFVRQTEKSKDLKQLKLKSHDLKLRITHESSGQHIGISKETIKDYYKLHPFKNLDIEVLSPPPDAVFNLA